MTAILIGIALKSLLIAGLTLGLLALLRKRCAAERSWVAHIGLLALIVLAFAPLALPRWTVEAPMFTAEAPAAVLAKPIAEATPAPATTAAVPAPAPAPAATASPVRIAPEAIATAIYALPAALLLFITLIALFRLVALQSRAEVLVDAHWLSALARAQRRMGFKYGTALLTSNDLSSPISWGLMRPVILLNARAVEAAGEAEAIIAHELAHVARLDWAKLLLARIATALFWFNPLVWLLAREAHQLREEAADDSVLAADIADTDYAQLLVGVARHECPGLLLGAHGVAPSKNSLARRVARVLDGKSVRGPVARSFAWGVLAGAVLVAAPLAALTITPAGSGKTVANAAKPSASAVGKTAEAPYYSVIGDAPPADLANIIRDGVTTAVAAVSVATPERAEVIEARVDAATDAIQAAEEAREIALAQAAKTRVAAERHSSSDRIGRIIGLRALGINAEYIAAMRAAAPQLRELDPAEFTGMKAVGVTPAYARALAAAGLRNLDEDELTSARAVGLTADYARGLARAGLRPDIDNYIELHAVGIPESFIAGLRASDKRTSDADEIVEMWAVGMHPVGRSAIPAPPRPPVPPPRHSDPDG